MLNVGCGPRRDRLHPLFRDPDWREIRLDIDPAARPDIVASMSDLGCFAPGTVDAVWSSHNLEHLWEDEARRALAEMVRVLKPTGFALITTPDLARVARKVAAGGLDDVLYHSPAGPVGALDILFGFRPAIARGNAHMAHRTGFDEQRLGRFLVDAGFAEARVWPGRRFDLWALGLMPDAGPVAPALPGDH